MELYSIMAFHINWKTLKGYYGYHVDFHESLSSPESLTKLFCAQIARAGRRASDTAKRFNQMINN